MSLSLADLSVSSLVIQAEEKTLRNNFIATMEGIYSASIRLNPVKWGAAIESEGNIIRKFFYNERGKVIKKLFFNDAGQIEMKEEFEFNDKGKITDSRFITDDAILRETYVYDERGYLKEYTLINPRRGVKRELYVTDKEGRKTQKISYGLLGTEELITRYIFPGNSQK